MPIQRQVGPSATGQTPSSRGPGQELSAALRELMESAFNFDFSKVRVHQDGQAEAMGAVAYTQGTNLYFARGAYDPSSTRGQELIGHELAHVIQQSEGRVRATGQAKGVGINEDDHLERQADAWGARAARSEPIDRDGAATSPGAAGPVQMQKVSSQFGEFEANPYHELPNDELHMELKFTPNDKVDATKIGLTQAVRSSIGALGPTEASRRVPARQIGAGYTIDVGEAMSNPMYGASEEDRGPLKDFTSDAPDLYDTGYRHTDLNGVLHSKPALLVDTPSSGAASLVFETTALALKDAQMGTYYGSVEWGFTRDHHNVMHKIDLRLLSEGTPTENFLAAASQWNASTAQGTVVTIVHPTLYQRENRPQAEPLLGQYTIVKILDTIGFMGGHYSKIRVLSGPYMNTTGFVSVNDLADLNDGAPATPLPVLDVQRLTEPLFMRSDVGEIKLPRGTRVVMTGVSQTEGTTTAVEVRVVDGLGIDLMGFVDVTKLRSERP